MAANTNASVTTKEQRSNSKKPPGYRRNIEKAIEELQEKFVMLENERKQTFLQAQMAR